MAKNAKENPQIKGRQTKLSKKSHDELIEIILKKDKVERNLNNQVVNLKSEVNALSTRIKGLYKDQEGNDKIIKELRDSCSAKDDRIKSLREIVDNNTEQLETHEFNYNNALKETLEITNKANSYKNLFIYTAIFAVLEAVALIFCF